jgi:ABC-type sugar transport system permease subunit
MALTDSVRSSMTSAQSHSQTATAPRSPARHRAMRRALPYLLSLPALLVCIGILIPFFTAVYYSMMRYRLNLPMMKGFIWFDNYISFLSDGAFWNTISISLIYAFVTVTGELVLGLGIALVMISFWALFFRKAAETFRLGGLAAGFEVSTADWLKFYARIIGLTIITLGFGSLMWGYWRWEFVMDRLELYGEIDVTELTQSTTAAPRDAEGFADAFDIGAF